MSTTTDHPGSDEPELTADEIARLAAPLADALEDEPFELIGYVALAASALHDDLGDHLRDLATEDPRLQPVLATIVASMPMVADLAPPADEVALPLPAWLERLEETHITGAMRRWEDDGRTRSSYLLEVSVPTVRPVTAVVRLGDCGSRFVVTDLHTMTASATETADDLHRRFEWINRRPYQRVSIDEAVGVIRRAFVRWLIHECERCEEERPFPGWPLTAPELSWILGLPQAQSAGEAA